MQQLWLFLVCFIGINGVIFFLLVRTAMQENMQYLHAAAHQHIRLSTFTLCMNTLTLNQSSLNINILVNQIKYVLILYN